MKQTTFNTEKKNEVLAIAKSHREADRFVQGNWLQDGKDEEGMHRGCFFGCMVQKKEYVLSTAAEELDIPLWLIHVSERIFEGLSKQQAVEFPVQLIESIPADTDLTSIWKKWNRSVLIDQLRFTEEGSQQYNAVLECADLFLLDEISESAARSARSAAWSAWSAWSARSAAWSAWSAARSAWSARSAESAWSAESAAWSARSAAWSAESAARESHYVWMRDTLIKILKS